MSLISLVNSLFTVYKWLILARVIISWVAPYSAHPVVRFVYDMTEPLLSRLRRSLPLVGGLDFSPFIALIIIQVMQRLVVSLLYNTLFF
ncbi:MAG: YggT family protein [Firmicutes bacterium]|nr:YggT family protein [Bacillota bacterium]